MLLHRFTRDARRVVEAALGEARRSGSATVEAEHLLLALARRPHPALAGSQLSAEALQAALAEESRASLAALGVDWDAPARRPGAGEAPEPRFAASAKLALERALPIAVARHDHRLTSDHVLLGVLEAEVGTVPRALAIAGVEPRELRLAV